MNTPLKVLLSVLGAVGAVGAAAWLVNAAGTKTSGAFLLVGSKAVVGTTDSVIPPPSGAAGTAYLAIRATPGGDEVPGGQLLAGAQVEVLKPASGGWANIRAVTGKYGDGTVDWTEGYVPEKALKGIVV